MRSVRFHEAGDYIDDQRPEYGMLFHKEVRAACGELAQDPLRWSIKLRGFRKYLTARFKYLIWYRETSNDEIYVIAVHHSSRKPGYWKDRILDEQR